jgi:hypothetical protein
MSLNVPGTFIGSKGHCCLSLRLCAGNRLAPRAGSCHQNVQWSVFLQSLPVALFHLSNSTKYESLQSLPLQAAQAIRIEAVPTITLALSGPSAELRPLGLPPISVSTYLNHRLIW